MLTLSHKHTRLRERPRAAPDTRATPFPVGRDASFRGLCRRPSQVIDDAADEGGAAAAPPTDPIFKARARRATERARVSLSLSRDTGGRHDPLRWLRRCKPCDT